MRYLLFFLIAFPFINLSAQDKPDPNTKFYSEKIKEYRAWLTNSNLSKYISCDTFSVEDKIVTLKLKASSWDSLQTQFKTKFKISLIDYLTDKILFTFDLKPEEARFEIDAGRNTLFGEYKKDKLQIEKLKKQGKFSDVAKINISEIKLASVANAWTDDTYEKTVRKLKNGLVAHYKKKEPRLLEKIGFDTIDTRDGNLTVGVRNIVDEVLSEGYFEKINIDFIFKEEGKKLLINYTVDCKYASGILWAPKSSGWRDTEVEYKDAVETYIKKMKAIINDILRN